MDALEFHFPVDMAPPKLIGSDGSVRVGEVEVCESDRVFDNPSSSFQQFGSYDNKKVVTSSINVSASASMNKIPNGAFFRDAVISGDIGSRNKKCILFSSGSRVQLRKALKVSRSSSSSCSKRPRAVQLENSLSLNGADDIKDTSDKLGSYLKKCSSHEKGQLLKQKSSLSSKRGDKRNLKVSLKTKFDSLSINAGSGSTAAGSSFLGLYGLKPDVHDFTKLLDDPPLNDLLDDNYDCPSLGIDKGKKDTNVNECFLQSVRKACSVLQLPWPIRSQNIAETESCSNSKPSTSIVSSVSSIEEGGNVDIRGTSATEAPSSNKVEDSCCNSGTLTNTLNIMLHKPDDMFVKLDLPVPKDLESLLQDASKSSASSKNATDLRSGKQQSRRAILQPFPWSHSFNGHCKANSDSSKLSANRSTCPESQGKMKYQANDQPCPIVIAAAQTLYDIATSAVRQSIDGIIRWPKKPSQKSMRARKLKTEETEELCAAPTYGLCSDFPLKHESHMFPSKKPKLGTIESKIDLGQTNCRRGPLNWATPRSSRSSPNKFIRDSISETKYSTSSIVKQSCMMPPPATILCKAGNGQPKTRKIMLMDWKRGGRDRLD